MQGAYGPQHLFKGVGHHINAVCGYSATTGWPDSDPTMIFSAYSDFIAPWYSLIAIMGALLERRRTGKGMYIEQAQMECGVSFLAPHVLNCAVNGRDLKRRGNRDFYMCPHGVYPCRGSDRWVAIAVQDEQQWQWFCDVIGNPEWTRDGKFTTILSRKQNEDELDKLIGEWTRAFTPEQVMTMMQEAGVPAGVVQTCEELLQRPADEAPQAPPRAEASRDRGPFLPRAGIRSVGDAVRHQPGGADPGAGQRSCIQGDPGADRRRHRGHAGGRA